MSLKPHIPVSLELAQRILDDALPGERVADVSRLYGGEIAAIYQIALASGAPSVVLKLYPASLDWKLRKEAAMLRLVEGRLRVPAPRVLRVDDSKQLLELNFMVMTKLDGEVLGAIEGELTPDEYLSAHRRIGALLRDFHAISMPAFGYIGPEGIWTPHPTNRAYLTHQFARKIAQFRDRGGDAALVRRITDSASAHQDMLEDCQAAVLCHNDLHAGNLMARVAADGSVALCGVLDFENTQAADPLMDVAKAAYYLKPEARAALVAGYGDTGRPNADRTLRHYHLYFALELWCWMAEIGNEAALPGIALDLDRACEA